jgi:hypothetical protein
MKKRVIFPAACLFTFFFWYDGVAQDKTTDSALYLRSVSAARGQYMKNIGANSYLYNGMAYENYWNKIIGHPFFIDGFQQGTLDYDGTFYEDVPLEYDISRDELITKNFAKNIDIRLLNEKVRSFTISLYTFVRIDADSGNTSAPSTGFYERLYKGAYTVLEKHKKEILHSMSMEEPIKFKEYDHFYIEKDGKYFTIETEGDLLSLFKDQRAEMRKFLNRKDTRFKKNKEKAIVQAVIYYEQLKK